MGRIMHSQPTATLRIVTAYQIAAETGAAYILELKGRLQGDSMEELRRVWRPLREVVAAVPISVVLADVECIDAAGKALLGEMHDAGTVITEPVASECGAVDARNIMEAGAPA
jgi:ABC-type transporter Mla MlaB component